MEESETSSLLLLPPPTRSPSSSLSAKYRSIDSFIDFAAAAASSSASSSASKNGNTLNLLLPPLPPPRYLLTIVSLGIANASFSTSILLMSYLLADANFTATVMQNDPTRYGGTLAAAVFAGMLPGGLLGGTACDTIGRRPLLLTALTANLLTALGTAAVADPITLVGVRFAAGLAVGATEPALFALVTELSPRKHRGLCVAFVASFWMVGNLVVATVGLVVFRYLGWSWRAYVLLCAIPAGLGLVLVAAFVPESPRFLAAVGGRYEDAVAVANGIAASLGWKADALAASASAAASGDKDSAKENDGPLRLEEVMHKYPPQQCGTAEEDNDGHNDRDKSNPWRSMLKLLSGAVQHASLLYGPQLRNRTTLPLQVVWFCLCYGSYCLVEWINTIYVAVDLDDMYANLLIFALANLPGNVLSFVLIDRAGRIRTLIWTLALSALSLVTFAWYARPGHVSTAGVVASSCTFQALETVAWNVLDVATGELFPTQVRSTGIGVSTATGRMGAMAAQFASGALIEWPGAILLVASSSLAIAAVVPFKMERGEMSRLPLADEVCSKKGVVVEEG